MTADKVLTTVQNWLAVEAIFAGITASIVDIGPGGCVARNWAIRIATPPSPHGGRALFVPLEKDDFDDLRGLAYAVKYKWEPAKRRFLAAAAGMAGTLENDIPDPMLQPIP